MKSKMVLIVVLACLSVASIAAPSGEDYERLRKDIGVMAKIITGAFEEDKSCDNCDPKIETSYLANQGAVFIIKANTWRRFDTHNVANQFSFVMSPEAPMAGIEISEIVADALESAGDAMEGMESHFEIMLDNGMVQQRHIRIDTETRGALRELGRELRELEYQRREHELELIHADDKHRAEVKKSIAELQKKADKISERRKTLEQKFEQEQKERLAAVAEEKARAEKESRAQLELFENIVMQSFCDYGATLRNLPGNEHVSLIFEQKNKQERRVYVLKKDDVANCKQVKSLKSNALSYLF